MKAKWYESVRRRGPVLSCGWIRLRRSLISLRHGPLICLSRILRRRLTRGQVRLPGSLVLLRRRLVLLRRHLLVSLLCRLILLRYLGIGLGLAILRPSSLGRIIGYRRGLDLRRCRCRRGLALDRILLSRRIVGVELVGRVAGPPRPKITDGRIPYGIPAGRAPKQVIEKCVSRDRHSKYAHEDNRQCNLFHKHYSCVNNSHITAV
jgi:hypothetical protein